MNIIDISWPIFDNMTHYKDKKRFTAERHIRNSYLTEHTLTLHNHIGTHIDSPLHVDPAGLSIDQIPLSVFVGPCQVIDVSHVIDFINVQDLSHLPISSESRILLKTRNSKKCATDLFDHSFVALSVDAARFLVEKQILLIGFDYLGIERNQPNHDTHKIFAQKNIPILEGLRLAHVHAGNYNLSALPINFINLDAAPARAILTS